MAKKPYSICAEPRRRAVAHGREVRHDAEIPEQHRRDDVGEQRHEVPQQRRLPLRPQRHRVRVGKQPVGEPGPAEMQDRIDAGADRGEQRHRLGDAVDRGAPLRPAPGRRRRRRTCRRTRWRSTRHRRGSGKPHITGQSLPQTRMPRVERPADAAAPRAEQHDATARARSTTSARPPRRSGTALTRSVIERDRFARIDHRQQRRSSASLMSSSAGLRLAMRAS